MKTIFLGGTCNGSDWREKLIPLLKIDYFNPVVKDWTPECQAKELEAREKSDYVLYVITPRMTGVYAIAEAVDDSNKRPNQTLFCYLKEDGYTLNLNVSNSSLFRGTIDVRPRIPGRVYGENQKGLLIYAIDCDIVNPNNPSQTKNVGKLVGTVPVDENNVYRFQEGDLKMNVFAMGGGQGLESKYGGLALGKPPVKSSSWSSLNFTSNKATITVTKYDKMTFQNHELAAGPVPIYTPVRFNGDMIYDYNRGAWLINNLAAVYSYKGQAINDTISGNVRWIETPARKTTGEGEYQFDIRVNEPPATEAAAFAGPSDEAAFFANDVKIPGLTGTMKYKDTFSKGVVTSSFITVELTGNQLSKEQTMYLFKLFFLSSVVPLNAE